MKTTEKRFTELKIEAMFGGKYAVIVDGDVKAVGIEWDEIVSVVRALEASYDEPILE